MKYVLSLVLGLVLSVCSVFATDCNNQVQVQRVVNHGHAQAVVQFVEVPHVQFVQNHHDFVQVQRVVVAPARQKVQVQKVVVKEQVQVEKVFVKQQNQVQRVKVQVKTSRR